MGEKTGRAGEKLCFGFGALFGALVLIQTVWTVWWGGYYAWFIGGAAVLGALVFLCRKFCRPWKGFPLALFLLRFCLALGVILLFGAQPTSDFETMYGAAVQMARGGREYLQGDYFYNWAYQTGFVAYEALVIRLFGEGQLPLQVLNALWMAGTGTLVYAIGRRFLPERGAVTASLFYALYPAPYTLAAVLTNQHIGAFFYYLGVWLLVRERRLSLPRALLAGVSIALGNVMRPLGAVVVLAVLCWGAVRLLRWQGEGLWREGGFLLAAAVTYFACTELFSGLVAVTGLNPQGLSNNLPLWKFLVGLNGESHGGWSQADYDAFYLLPPEQAEEAMGQEIARRLSVGPRALLQLFWDKTQNMWGTPEYLYWGFWHLDGSTQVLGTSLDEFLLRLNYWDRGIYLLAFALAAAGLAVRLFRGKDGELRVPLLLGFLFCGYYAAHIFIEVQSRYRYFIMPAVFLLAGAGWELLWDLWRNRKRARSPKEGAPGEIPS